MAAFELTCPHCSKRFTVGDEPPSPEAVPVSKMVALWVELFPKKTRPRQTPELRRKLASRWKDNDFRSRWEATLNKAAASPFLNEMSWFQFHWLIKNESNWWKVFNEEYRTQDERMAAEKRAISRSHAGAIGRREDETALKEYKRQALSATPDDQIRILEKAERNLPSHLSTHFGAWLQDVRQKQLLR